MFVLWDDRVEPPAWLSNDFADTGLDIGLDTCGKGQQNVQLGQGPGQSIDQVFSVWKRDVLGAETVILGPMSTEGQSEAQNSMYGIAAVALDET